MSGLLDPPSGGFLRSRNGVASRAVHPDTLFHYTDIGSFGKIISTKGLLCRPVADSADEQEMQLAHELFGDLALIATSGVAPSLWSLCEEQAVRDDNLGMVSFSADGDSPNLWNFPSPEEPTVALELAAVPFLEAALALDPDAELVECVSDRDTQERLASAVVSDAGSRLGDGKQLGSEDLAAVEAACRDLARRLVYSPYGGEREWRLLLTPTWTDDPVIVAPSALPLVRVLVERGRPEAADAAEAILQASGWKVKRRQLPSGIIALERAEDADDADDADGEQRSPETP